MTRDTRLCSAARTLYYGSAATAFFLAACGGDQQRSDAGPAASSASPSTAAAGVSGAEQLYQQRCSSCHQPNGQGLAGSFPPLAGSEYATAANVAVPIMIVLHGIQGPLTVHGAEYNGVMPQYGMGIEMSNDEVASLLTYVRSSWGNRASAVTPQDVARVRAAPRSATGSVTAEELAPLM